MIQFGIITLLMLGAFADMYLYMNLSVLNFFQRIATVVSHHLPSSSSQTARAQSTR